MNKLIPAIAGAFLLAAALPNAAGADKVRSLTLEDRTNPHEAAAARGEARAQTALGLKFSEHKTAESDVAAFGWLRRAAEQGDAEAQLLLSGLYATGRGTGKDLVQAYKWAYLSGLRANEPEIIVNASNLIGVLGRQMTESEIDQARLHANGWKPKLEVVQTAAAQPERPTDAAPRASVEIPAPVKAETATALEAPVAAHVEVATKTAPAEAAPHNAPDAQAKAAPAPRKKAGRGDAKRTAAAPSGKLRAPRHRDLRYEDMVGTAISYARAYGIHLGGWSY